MDETPFDSLKLHRDTIATWLIAAEQAFAKYDARHPGTIDRHQAIAAVVLEAGSMWDSEIATLTRISGHIAEGDYRELAAATEELVHAQADSIVFALAPGSVRRQALDAAMTSIYGPSDDDS